LVGAILLYDSWLKRTWAGPLAMGGCRFLNVLLGLTVAGTAIPFWGYHLALVVGLYAAGITWFARTEARASRQAALLGATLVILASLVMALLLPARFDPSPSSPLFPYLLVVFAFGVGLPLHRAIVRPTPPLVQAAVTRALRGLVVLDAVLATALAGTIGLALLVLLIPIFLLNRWRWLYAT
jgi:4-hydroxybenzoate polyprenyltransferase